MRTAGICSNKRQDYNSFWMLEYDVYEIKIGLIFKSNIKFNKEHVYMETIWTILFVALLRLTIYI